MKVKKAHLEICKRLGIDPTKLKDPNVRALFDAHLAKCREILTEEIPITQIFPKPPGAVQGCTVSNRKLTNNATPVLPEQIRTEGGAAKLKPGQRKKVGVKVPPMHNENPFR